MSYGGHISDRALWDKQWYNGFRHHDGKFFSFTFYDGKDRHDRPYGILFTPDKTDPRYLCTGNSRQRNFYSKRERYQFYKKMKQFMQSVGLQIEKETKIMRDGFIWENYTDYDINDGQEQEAIHIWYLNIQDRR